MLKNVGPKDISSARRLPSKYQLVGMTPSGRSDHYYIQGGSELFVVLEYKQDLPAREPRRF